MSALDDARALLDSIREDAEPKGTGEYVPSQSRPVRLGAVDPAYAGVGNPRVTFEGESSMSVKTYPTLGPVAADARVVLLPVGRTYVILGAIWTGP